MIDPAFSPQPASQDQDVKFADVALFKVKEYLSAANSGVAEPIKVARCVRTTKADGVGGQDGNDSYYVVVTSNVDVNKTLVALRVTPDTGYVSAGGYSYVWQQLAGGSTLPTGTLYDTLVVVDNTGVFVAGKPRLA